MREPDSRGMSHYSLEQLTDFVRGLAVPELFVAINSHVEGCGDCARDVSMLNEAVAISWLDRNFEPPPYLVDSAQNIFSPVPPAMVDSLGTRLKRLAAHLEWDSFGGVALAGVRSLRPGARHIVYRAGRYSIDVILDNDPESDVMVLTGQVADETAPDSKTGVLKPILLAGQEVISTTASTESGEFSIQYRPGRELSLWIPMEMSGECIEVPLLPNTAESN